MAGKDYIISIKRVEVTPAGTLRFVARIKYKGQYTTVIFDENGGWKIYYESSPIPKTVFIDAKEELQQRVQKIIEKIDDILALGNGLGVVIEFK